MREFSPSCCTLIIVPSVGGTINNPASWWLDYWLLELNSATESVWFMNNLISLNKKDQTHRNNFLSITYLFTEVGINRLLGVLFGVIALTLFYTGHWKFNMAPHGKLL